MQKKDLIISGVFLIWIFGLLAANWLLPSREFSELENRNLMQRPSVSAASIVDGSFESNFETYLNDQFAGRDLLVKINKTAVFASGIRISGGVYACGDTLIQSFTDQGKLESNCEAAAAFKKRSKIPVYFALIPSAAAIKAAELPKGAPNADQQELIKKAYALVGDGIDLYSILKLHEQESIYYRTDHHWTSTGAEYGYAAIAEDLGLEASLDYEPVIVSESFYGTLYSNQPLWWIAPDEIQIYVPETGVTVEAFTGTEVLPKELYCEERLKLKDKYSYFLGGNQPLITVKTKNTAGDKLLLLRDSYADSLTPFLTANYSEIHLVDPRYYKLSIDDYIAENEIDTVLIIYSLPNFCEDTNLAYVLRQ